MASSAILKVNVAKFAGVAPGQPPNSEAQPRSINESVFASPSKSLSSAVGVLLAKIEPGNTSDNEATESLLLSKWIRNPRPVLPASAL